LLFVRLHPTASTILDQGASVIVSGGAGVLTMRRVAAHAGIKLASLQYHFKTFDALVSALFHREWRAVADVLWNTVEEIERQEMAAIPALRKAVESFMPPAERADQVPHKIYYHLMAFCSYDSGTFPKAKAFYRFYNTLIAYLVARVNPSLSAAECLTRATLITSTLEGSCVYTILRVGGASGDAAVRNEIARMTIQYATLE
jgi:AcrR family transcriptional regulator